MCHCFQFNEHLQEEIVGAGKTKYYSATSYEKLLKLRLEELKAFHEMKNYLDDFVKFATSLKKGMSWSIDLESFKAFYLIELIILYT